MHHDTMSTRTEYRSPFALAMGLLGAGLGFAAWFQSGELWALFGGIAFLALAPAWYRLPISLTKPMKDPRELARTAAFPKWAQVLTVLGFVLLGVAMWLRWVA